MRLYVVYDDQGTILAAVEVPAEYQTEGRIRPEYGEYPVGFDVPLAEAGEHAAAFDVPAEFAGQHVLEVVRRVQVDVNENRLVERR
jgi:hypothetical protein